MLNSFFHLKSLYKSTIEIYKKYPYYFIATAIGLTSAIISILIYKSFNEQGCLKTLPIEECDFDCEFDSRIFSSYLADLFNSEQYDSIKSELFQYLESYQNWHCYGNCQYSYIKIEQGTGDEPHRFLKLAFEILKEVGFNNIGKIMHLGGRDYDYLTVFTKELMEKCQTSSLPTKTT